MKDIISYEKLYAITPNGQVWAYPKIQEFQRKGKLIIRRYKGHWLSSKGRRDGYVCVNLFKENGSIFYYVHRLVAEAFIPNPNNLPDINHLDNNPSNNLVENLEWCSTSHNVQYAYKTGRRIPLRGEKTWSAKLTPKKVLKIRKLCMERKMNYKKIGKLFGVSKQTISGIKNRWKWKHI